MLPWALAFSLLAFLTPRSCHRPGRLAARRAVIQVPTPQPMKGLKGESHEGVRVRTSAAN